LVYLLEFMELGQDLIYLYLWELGQGNLEFGINAYNILVLVGIAGYAVAPLYKYMWTYLVVDRIHT
jgi:hypothetical protein